MTIRELLNKVAFAGYLRIVTENSERLLVTTSAETLETDSINEDVLERRVVFVQPRSDIQSSMFGTEYSIPVTEIIVR